MSRAVKAQRKHYATLESGRKLIGASTTLYTNRQRIPQSMSNPVEGTITKTNTLISRHFQQRLFGRTCMPCIALLSLQRVLQMQRYRAVQTSIHMHKNIEFNSTFHRQPVQVQFCQHWGYVIMRKCEGDTSCCRVLNVLQAVQQAVHSRNSPGPALLARRQFVLKKV